MTKSIIGKYIGGGCGVLLVLALALSAGAAEFQSPSNSRFHERQVERSAAIKKVGFLMGLENGTVQILEDKAKHPRTYPLANNLVVTHHGQPYDRDRLVGSSRIALYIANGRVIEIVLIMEPS